MKKILLVTVIIACSALSIVAQTGSGKTPTSQGKQPISRRAVKLDQTSSTPFSPAILAGDFVFVSGQLGVDRKTGEFAGTTTEEQAEQVLKNLATVLEASGSDMEHIVKTTVFLADMEDFAKMNEIYRRHFKGDPPARSTVQVARLPRNARIEIEAIAIVKKGG
ncbi:MAG TPA: RidA family protein [Pyrinomonadaceae bacterium]|jgi:2-iminobutanoate/2-iminopropanoate deaminase